MSRLARFLGTCRHAFVASAGLVAGGLGACDDAVTPAFPDTPSVPDGFVGGDSVDSDTVSGVDGGGVEACLDERSTFLEKVWTPVLERSCLTCHQPGGMAWEQKARFIIVPATYPGFVEQNIAAVKSMLGYRYEDEPLLLAKPSNLAPHGGGPVLPADSANYAAFRDWLDTLGESSTTPETCEDPDALSPHPLEPAAQTLRRVALELAGRLPTPAELALVEADPTKLADAVYSLTTGPIFDEWLKTAWNDVLLVDLYMSTTGRSTNLLSATDFPNSRDAYFNTLAEADRRAVTIAIAREPLELIAYVVREGLPFSTILTADFAVVNALAAPVLGIEHEDDGVTDPLVPRPGRIHYSRDGGQQPWPHAGILSSPMVLNRFPTTPTNLNRHRSWWVMRTFLATDILTVADRPVDPDQASNFTLPWRQDSQCVVCHAVLDPIAGGWAGFDDRDPDRYFPERNAPTNVFDPGYDTELMPANPAEGRLRWIADRVAADPRFPVAVARLTWTMLTGRPPIDHPRGVDRATFLAERRAWRAFDRMLADVVEVFVESSLDWRALVAAIVAHPLFRVDGFALPTDPATAALVTADTDDSRAELAPFARRRWLTPELLERKLTALFGFRWENTQTRASFLLGEYRLLYGGIDSEQVTVRLDVPNGIMASIAERMSHEIACVAVPWEFARDPETRLLLKGTRITDTATTLQGDDIPAARQRIREAMAQLHGHLLGVPVRADSPEVDTLFALFDAIQVEGRLNVKEGRESATLQCRARNNPETREELPPANRIENDPDYTVRAWMAVVSYLVSDYRFMSH
jgi:hypothetical protein